MVAEDRLDRWTHLDKWRFLGNCGKLESGFDEPIWIEGKLSRNAQLYLVRALAMTIARADDSRPAIRRSRRKPAI